MQVFIKSSVIIANFCQQAFYYDDCHPYCFHPESQRAVMLSKPKLNKHQQYLAQLPKLSQTADHLQTIYSPKIFRTQLLELISRATQRIWLIALYLENDDAGQDVLAQLYQAKQRRPDLEVYVLVDWYRAQRGRIGEAVISTNADWYCETAKKYPGICVPVYGIPVNTREALGVLHLKGFIIDNTVLYSGASINNVYLQQHDKYRYDRYQLIQNAQLATVMIEYIRQHLLQSDAVQRLDIDDRLKKQEIKNKIRHLRYALRNCNYHFINQAGNEELTVTPLVGLGTRNLLNKTIHHLMLSVEQHLVICTPYFNLPTRLLKNIVHLLYQGKQVEMILGDKTANDFYIPQDQPFKMIGALPYLYEVNLYSFLRRLQPYVNTGQLIIRLWKDGENSYHVKGIWIDDRWQLITGNNLNLRAWRLDLENAILIHDPHQQLYVQRQTELECIRANTQVISHYLELETIKQYPVKIRKLIIKLRRIRMDRLISHIL